MTLQIRPIPRLPSRCRRGSRQSGRLGRPPRRRGHRTKTRGTTATPTPLAARLGTSDRGTMAESGLMRTASKAVARRSGLSMHTLRKTTGTIESLSGHGYLSLRGADRATVTTERFRLLASGAHPRSLTLQVILGHLKPEKPASGLRASTGTRIHTTTPGRLPRGRRECLSQISGTIVATTVGQPSKAEHIATTSETIDAPAGHIRDARPPPAAVVAAPAVAGAEPRPPPEATAAGANRPSRRSRLSCSG